MNVCLQYVIILTREMCDTNSYGNEKNCVCIIHTEMNIPCHHCERQYSESLAFYKLQLLSPPQAAALHTSDEELAEKK